MRHLNKQRGVGLIEVLVAVLVLSIGLLGLAGLQMRTLRNNQSSLERGVAVVETHAIADAMRADRIKAEAGQYNILPTAPAPTSPSTFRDKAIAGWRANLITSIGSGATGGISCNTGATATCTITIQWDDTRVTGGSATQSIATEVRL